MDSGIQKLLEGDTQKHRQQGDLISLLLFFKSKESGLKIVACIQFVYSSAPSVYVMVHRIYLYADMLYRLGPGARTSPDSSSRLDYNERGI
jgi:hypothetical protein